jgi:uncharacterized NAD(P)/FAD-binding protein YdhS
MRRAREIVATFQTLNPRSKTMQRIAIVGGGAAGGAVVGEFLRRGSDVELTWLVGSCAPGRGVAYAASDGLHLLNVRAANMGLFADDVGGFIRFVQANNHAGTVGDFLPRTLFGDYVEDTLARLLVGRSRNVGVETYSVEAIGIDRNDEGGYVVHADSGQTFAVDGIVLAIGALPPVPIAEVHPEALDSGRYLPNPWQAPKVEQAPQRVVVLGSGLTAVDVILAAATRWPDSQIVALSRHGRLPATHRAEPGPPFDRQSQLIELLRAQPAARRWIRLVREAAEDASDWRAPIDGLRAVSVELWRSLDSVQRRRFLRHLRWAWEIVRHRMPPQTDEALELLQDEGRLIVVAGRIRRVEGRSPLILTYRQRDDGSTHTLAADLAIQATGLQTAVKRTSHRLLQQMFQARLVRADPQGLGIDADVSGRVIRADGSAANGLRVIGTLLRGVLWECTAMPEIRMMAARVARELLAELRQHYDRPAVPENTGSSFRQNAQIKDVSDYC